MLYLDIDLRQCLCTVHCSKYILSKWRWGRKGGAYNYLGMYIGGEKKANISSRRKFLAMWYLQGEELCKSIIALFPRQIDWELPLLVREDGRHT